MYAGVSRITSKGQVTIPLEIREDKGLDEGDQVMFIEVGGEVIMDKTENLFSIFRRRAKEIGLTKEQLAKEMKEQKKKTLARMEKQGKK